MRLLIVGLVLLLSASVFAEADQTIRTNAGALPATPGNRYCADLASGLYVAIGRGTSSQNGLMFQGTVSTGSSTWTKYVDSALIAGGVGSYQVTQLGDTIYFGAGQDAVTYRIAKLFYNSGTSRDTLIPKDTVGSTATAAPSGHAFQYRADTLITVFDDSSGATVRPAKTNGRLTNGTETWTIGNRRFLGANAGNVVQFPFRDAIALFTCGSGGHHLYSSDGTTIDSVSGGANLFAPEGNLAVNVSFIARSAIDSVVMVFGEMNDSSVARLGKFSGSAYPYTWVWLTDWVRVDSRLSPTGDAVAGGRKEGRTAMLGSYCYLIYKDWRDVANVDSVDICERHIDLSSIPPNLSGLSAETILRHAVNGVLIVEMMTPERFNTTRSLLWEVWRDDAAAGSRTISAHIDTVSASSPPTGRQRDRRALSWMWPTVDDAFAYEAYSR